LKNASTNMCAVIAGASLTPGTHLINNACPTSGTGSANERFTYTARGRLLDLQSSDANPMCLNIPNASAVAGAPVAIWGCSDDSLGLDHVSNDNWDFSSDGRIHARMAPAMCLDSGTGAQNSDVKLQPCSDAQSQIFSVI
jgi:hypothetical protein